MIGWRKALGVLSGTTAATYVVAKYVDQKVSTFNKRQNVNIANMMDGNKTEYMFKAAKNGARRHKNMGYN